MSQVIQPLLKLVSEHTGYPCVSLVAGTYTDGGKVASVNYGATPGPESQQFPEWNPDIFRREFCASLLKFVFATKGLFRCLRAPTAG